MTFARAVVKRDALHSRQEKSVLFETMRNDSIAKADDGVQGLRTTTAQHHEAEEKALVLPGKYV